MGREGQDETGRRIKRFHGWTHSVCRNVFHTMDYLLTNSAFVRDQAGWTWIGLLVRFRVRLFVSAPECRCKGGKWTSRGAFTTSSPAASTSSGEVQTNPRLSTPSKSGLGQGHARVCVYPILQASDLRLAVLVRPGKFKGRKMRLHRC